MDYRHLTIAIEEYANTGFAIMVQRSRERLGYIESLEDVVSDILSEKCRTWKPQCGCISGNFSERNTATIAEPLSQHHKAGSVLPQCHHCLEHDYSGTPTDRSTKCIYQSL